MPLTRLVNGERVELTLSEESDLMSKWAQETSAAVLLEKERDRMEATKLQARQALHLSGDLAAAEAVVAAADVSVQMAWADMNVIKRRSQMMMNFQAVLGWDDDKIDALFRIAMEIDL